ncbi:response regulator [Paenibacillus radicis (ex Xue et al. 2023)]|uniref:Response regulator transcription factor n=1 Tax=Paenibacillus radicis (ex Xue et al. 2023) TaxID=2972489 RepID=A0ABT1Y9E8_9BACL|nr:response regulator transcription factor [Paenibacillus radicis (ex Xue et al. 2023)]MCR8629809.1 response regulator transcription factor [Paenibacillus radicis (ex Xue et al. 2023)]
MTIKLLLADDHAIVRKGLQVFLGTLPDLELVGEAVNGQDTLDKVGDLAPDIVLIDLNMPVLNGIEATKRLKITHPNVKVIVLTSFSDQDHVLPAIRAGAKGYLLKDIEPEELVRAIRRVYEGHVELHSEAAGQLMNHVAAPELLDASSRDGLSSQGRSPFMLTPREQEVLRHIASGMSNKEISEALHITEKTVKTHVSHVLDKLGMTDRTQAAIFAVKRGLDK